MLHLLIKNNIYIDFVPTGIKHIDSIVTDNKVCLLSGEKYDIVSEDINDIEIECMRSINRYPDKKISIVVTIKINKNEHKNDIKII